LNASTTLTLASAASFGHDDKKRQEELYRGIWEKDPNYGTAYSDVEDTVAHRIAPHMHRLGLVSPKIVDFGAGDGRFLEVLGTHGMGYGTGVDLHMPENLYYWIGWIQAPMWLAEPKGFDYVISTDALEHLPPGKVSRSLENIAKSAPHGFLRISLVEDRYGTERGLHLHESVFPASTWLYLCRSAGIKVTSYKVYLGEDDKERALEVWF
jgi:2-polyprenyl-3-methyl-5-hydroxy-6-metoxy-1,4-benzoquinol methylase